MTLLCRALHTLLISGRPRVAGGFFAAVFLVLVGCQPHDNTIRIATFNIWELSAGKVDQRDERGHGTNVQLLKAAEIIQRVRPDILLINEIDFDPDRAVARGFQDAYLRITHNGAAPIVYPHRFDAPVNTGVPTGRDLDRDGRRDGPGDAYGFGRYPGQYGMALLSRYPIDHERARTFRLLRWAGMPRNLMPDGTSGKPAWYAPNVAAILRLSSKNHWDVPVRIGHRTLHLLASHPTPPIFDGPEDRNGRRNFDEIRFWSDYISGGDAASYIVDDQGTPGPLAPGALFVILGDLNADPVRSDAPYGQPAIAQLLDHPRVGDPLPRSPGAAAEITDYVGDASTATCEFGRIDYVLPCRRLCVLDSGVYWPAPDDPAHSLVAEPQPASDHRLVWVDIAPSLENGASAKPFTRGRSPRLRARVTLAPARLDDPDTAG